MINESNIYTLNNYLKDKDKINILEIVFETVLLLEYENKDILDRLNKSYLNIKKILNINNEYIDLCSKVIIKNILYKIDHKTVIQNNREILYKPNDNLFNILDNKSHDEIISILKTLNIIEIMILKNNYIFNDNIINVIDSYISTLSIKEINIINNNYMNIRIIE